MTKKPSKPYHRRRSTRHFLFSKAETKELEKKRVKTTASEQKALKSLFPDLLAGKSFLVHAIARLDSAKSFGGMVIRIDDKVNEDKGPGESYPNVLQAEAAKILDALCKEQNGIWGTLEQDIFGGFFLGKNGSECLTLARSFQKTLTEKTGVTATIGIAEYPSLSYKKAEVLNNARKALVHAAFFGSDSAIVFDAVSLNISGDKLFEKGDIGGAIKEFKQALKLDPTSVNVHNSLGVCYGLLGDNKKAKREFNTTIKLDSQEVMACYNLGLVNMLNGNREKALDLFIKASRIGPDVFEVAFQTGRLYLEMGKPKNGKKFLEQASRLQPKSGAVLRYLGECYASTGDIVAAISAYKKAIKKNPSDAASLSALGYLYDEQGENPEISLMFCQESVQLSPENGLFRYRLGKLYLKQHRLDEALKEFKKAESLGHDAAEFIAKIQNRQTTKAS